MAFFSFDKSVRMTLIGVALASNPGCYQSYGTTGDDAPDVADSADARDARDADAAEVRDDAADLPEIGDPVPYPMCTELPTYSLATTTEERAVDYAVGRVSLTGPESWEAACSTGTCLSVAPDGGRGTVSGVESVGSLQARFRYTNAGLGWGEMVRLEVIWRLYCTTGGSPTEDTVTGTAWACRDESGRVMVTSNMVECPSVVDCVPPPMASAPNGSPAASARSLRLETAADDSGAFRIRAVGPASGSASYRWLAPTGTLRQLSEDEALWEPPAEPGVHVVQVAAVSAEGVSVQVFRHRVVRRDS